MQMIQCNSCGSNVPVAAITGSICPACGGDVRGGGQPNQPGSAPVATPVAPAQNATTPPASPPASTRPNVAQQPPQTATIQPSAQPAQTSAQAAMPSQAVPQATGDPNLRIRKYPAMSVIMVVCYVVAGLLALEYLLTTVLLVASPLFDSRQQDLPAGVMILFGFVFNTILHGVPITVMVFFAESIKIMIDIQENTQRAAHYVQHG